MSTKIKLDNETKIELLIKLAFGLPLADLAIEYDLTEAKIINLRKNNYMLYNEFFEHWKICDEVAVLGLSPKHERAVNICKKFYHNKFIIISTEEIYYNNKRCSFNEIIDLADKILQKDDIFCFKELNNSCIKNFY